jgi:hypothetical protein
MSECMCAIRCCWMMRSMFYVSCMSPAGRNAKFECVLATASVFGDGVDGSRVLCATCQASAKVTCTETVEACWRGSATASDGIVRLQCTAIMSWSTRRHHCLVLLLQCSDLSVLLLCSECIGTGRRMQASKAVLPTLSESCFSGLSAAQAVALHAALRRPRRRACCYRRSLQNTAAAAVPPGGSWLWQWLLNASRKCIGTGRHMHASKQIRKDVMEIALGHGDHHAHTPGRDHNSQSLAVQKSRLDQAAANLVPNIALSEALCREASCSCCSSAGRAPARSSDACMASNQDAMKTLEDACRLPQTVRMCPCRPLQSKHVRVFPAPFSASCVNKSFSTVLRKLLNQL